MAQVFTAAGNISVWTKQAADQTADWCSSLREAKGLGRLFHVPSFDP
jgi:hypothetical protein